MSGRSLLVRLLLSLHCRLLLLPMGNFLCTFDTIQDCNYCVLKNVHGLSGPSTRHPFLQVLSVGRHALGVFQAYISLQRVFQAYISVLGAGFLRTHSLSAS